MTEPVTDCSGASMSLQMVEAEIAKFLTTERAEVLCINGKWGVGKTYSWNRLLKNACSSHRIALKSYAYVSLFGINSLDQLKFSIFENTVAAEDAGIEASIESFQTNADAVMNRLGRKALPFLQSTPVVRNYASALQSLSFLSVRNCIVCVDDLERKGNQLP